MSIGPDQVRDAARLARIALDEPEVATFAEQLAAILRHFERLSAVDTTQVPPTTHTVPLTCPVRDDTVTPFDPRERIVEQGPRVEDGHFAVPKVIE